MNLINTAALYLLIIAPFSQRDSSGGTEWSFHAKNEAAAQTAAGISFRASLSQRTGEWLWVARAALSRGHRHIFTASLQYASWTRGSPLGTRKGASALHCAAHGPDKVAVALGRTPELANFAEAVHEGASSISVAKRSKVLLEAQRWDKPS